MRTILRHLPYIFLSTPHTYIVFHRPVFETTLLPSRDPDLRMCMLALLESVLQLAGVQNAVRGSSSAVAALFERCVRPNLVWRVGRVAATIRKVASSCLYRMLCERLPAPGWLLLRFDELAPSVLTALDDGDAATRRLAAGILSELFGLLPGKLGDEAVRTMYPDLLKRLDDSNDAVRVAACAALEAFLAAAPASAYAGTPIDYMCDTFLVHLDDADATVQGAVFRVLCGATRMGTGRGAGAAALVAKKAAAVRVHHRSPRLCDELVRFAEEELDAQGTGVNE